MDYLYRIYYLFIYCVGGITSALNVSERRLPKVGLVASSHGYEFFHNQRNYALGNLIDSGCIAVQGGLTLISDDAVDAHGISPAFDSLVLEDQGEIFFSRRKDLRLKQREEVKEAIGRWPVHVTEVINLIGSNDEADLLYENGHLIHLMQKGINLFQDASHEERCMLGFYGHGTTYLTRASRKKITRSVQNFIAALLDFYSGFQHIERIYICGAVEREDTSHRDPALLMLWQLFNSCLEAYLNENQETWDIQLVFIPLVSALYSCPQPWSRRSSNYKVHRSKEGYAAIYSAIHDFIMRS